MYFETVLSYPATLYKWHLFNELLESPRGSSVYFFVSFLCFLRVLMFPVSFRIQRFNLFYSVSKLRLVTPVLFGIAKVEIFLALSSFLSKLFFFLFAGLIKRLKKYQSLLLTPQINLLIIPFTLSLPPKRDAKVRKLTSQTNIHARLIPPYP